MGAAAALGILPGGGSFYTRNYGAGVVNLLFWPASTLWDPVSGMSGAEFTNYYATTAEVRKRQEVEMRALEDSLLAETITKHDFVTQKRAIEDKFSPY